MPSMAGATGPGETGRGKFGADDGIPGLTTF
jgi:hypothetical protein